MQRVRADSSGPEGLPHRPAVHDSLAWRRHQRCQEGPPPPQVGQVSFGPKILCLTRNDIANIAKKQPCGFCGLLPQFSGFALIVC
jgi:hypothetical protein